MTATPRIVGTNIKDRMGVEYYKYISDMSNERLYGPEFINMNFGSAIKMQPPFLTDYKIVAIGVTNQEVREWVNKRCFTNGTTVMDIAHNIALHKAMTKYGAKHAVTFHSRIAAAKEFSNRHAIFYPKSDTFYVCGTQSSSERKRDISSFAESPLAVISNARCLTEGINVPAIDMVYFCDQKTSKIEIVQATGRALRKYKGKKVGYIVVPVFHMFGENAETAIQNSYFKILVSVVRAMADQDSRIEEEIHFLKYGLGKIHSRSPTLKSMLESAHIELVGFEPKLRRSIFSHIISKAVIKWRPFDAARAYVRKLNLKGVKDWQHYTKLPDFPSDIPVSPERVYQADGWVSYGDWLGTMRLGSTKRSFRSFEEARRFVRNLGLRSQKDWKQYSKSGKRPVDIPSSPNKVYKYDGWKGLGDWLGTGRVHKKSYRPFKAARSFAWSLKLKNQFEWFKFASSEKRPPDIPHTPSMAYKDRGWVSWGDWTGSNTIANQLRKFRSFKMARSYARSLKLKNGEEWEICCKTEKLPKDIPSNPNVVYKNKGWVGMGDWLGTGYVANQKRKYLPFRSARKQVQSLKFHTIVQWRTYAKSSKKPFNIPACPEDVYSKKGWKNYGDWLGTGTISYGTRKYSQFTRARAFVRKLHLKNYKAWTEFTKSKKMPADIPKAPDQYYSDSGWKGYGDWLGTGTIAPRNRDYLPFQTARKKIHKLKLKNVSEWTKFCDSGRLPVNIPRAPGCVYEDQGWQGFGDWLGNGTVATQLRKYQTFHKARKFVHKKNLRNKAEWKKYCRSGQMPSDIPFTPDIVYSGHGWKGYRDWLGTQGKR